MKLNKLIETLKDIKKLQGNPNVIFYSIENYNLEEIHLVVTKSTEKNNRLEFHFKNGKETYGDYLRSVYNNPKVNQEVKARIGNLMGRFDIRDRERKTEASQLILKYNDSNAKILIDSFRRAMINLRKDRGSSVVNQELNNKQYTTTDVLKTVERKLIKEGRIKIKGK